MTKAQEQDKLIRLLEMQNYRCSECGKYLYAGQPQRAHILSQSPNSRKKWGSYIIDSIYNWKYTCSLKCNQSVDLNYKANPKKAIEHISYVMQKEKE